MWLKACRLGPGSPGHNEDGLADPGPDGQLCCWLGAILRAPGGERRCISIHPASRSPVKCVDSRAGEIGDCPALPSAWVLLAGFAPEQSPSKCVKSA